jgi:CRISPR-associated protein Csm4
MPALLFKLQPLGPWRLGPDSGARDRVERICHSDTLYSAVSHAMGWLGWMDEWFDATARAPVSAVRLGSLFPWHDDALFAPAPAHLWPPQGTSRLRAGGAKFVPTYLVGWLASGHQLNEDHWDVDGLSECLLRRRGRRHGPFRVALRSFAAVDRVDHGVVLHHQTACLEFSEGAGLWCVAECADETWADRLESAMRLLGDSGVGGERSQGWGHFKVASVKRGELTRLLFDERFDPAHSGETGFWLLSLLCPAESDQVDWSRGAFTLVERRGFDTKSIHMVREGSVVLAPRAPDGAAPDVARDGAAHPVYRAGFALPVPLPWRVNA